MSRDNKTGYGALWLLLALALIVVTAVSFLDDITIGSYTVKKAPIADLLTDSVSEKIDSIAAEECEELTAPKVIVTDSMPQSIFIFGDSMTFNLALRLAQYAKQNGHTIHSVNWDSSNTKIWAEHDTLRYFIEKFHPTQIFISLGSNELYFKNPETRAPMWKRSFR